MTLPTRSDLARSDMLRGRVSQSRPLRRDRRQPRASGGHQRRCIARRDAALRAVAHVSRRRPDDAGNNARGQH